MNNLAPIALFVYRRPEHTRRTLQALQENPLARESDLIVFSDAAKQPQHEADVRSVRAILRENWGFRSVLLVERESNFGLAKSIVDGVGRLCSEFGRAIVIEDDITVAPDCLEFLNYSLDRYSQDEKVHQVSAYSYPANFSTSNDAFFLPMISCWGWATWARAWQHFDPSLSGLDSLRNDAARRREFNVGNTFDYFAMACQQARGEIDSWGICWQLNVFTRNGLVLYPRQSLAQNHGVDSSGTHGDGETALQPAIGTGRLNVREMRFPRSISVDKAAMSEVENLLASIRPGFVRRMVNWIRT